jgi:DNA-binding protein H-NS
MDLSGMNLGQLRELLEQVSNEAEKREKHDRQAAIDQIYSLAHQFGIPLHTLLAMDEKRKSRKATTPGNTYRDPANPENTWTGRGERPTWLQQALAGGADLAEFRVPMRP